MSLVRDLVAGVFGANDDPAALGLFRAPSAYDLVFQIEGPGAEAPRPRARTRRDKSLLFWCRIGLLAYDRATGARPWS